MLYAILKELINIYLKKTHFPDIATLICYTSS